MRFIKDIAIIKFTMKDGTEEGFSETSYDIDVDQMIENIKNGINEGRALLIGDGWVNGGDVRWFEITNYDDLVEMKHQRQVTEKTEHY